MSSRAHLLLKASGGNWDEDMYAELDLTREAAAHYLQLREVWRLAKTGAQGLYDLRIWEGPDSFHSYDHLCRTFPGGFFDELFENLNVADIPEPGLPEDTTKDAPRTEIQLTKIDGQDNGGVIFTWYPKHGDRQYSTDELPWKLIEDVYNGVYEPTYPEEKLDEQHSAE